MLPVYADHGVEPGTWHPASAQRDYPAVVGLSVARADTRRVPSFDGGFWMLFGTAKSRCYRCWIPTAIQFGMGCMTWTSQSLKSVGRFSFRTASRANVKDRDFGSTADAQVLPTNLDCEGRDVLKVMGRSFDRNMSGLSCSVDFK